MRIERMGSARISDQIEEQLNRIARTSCFRISSRKSLLVHRQFYRSPRETNKFSPMPSCPPRLHVLMAQDAQVAIVIRRGPSKYVATFLWDRRNDQFTLGQWLKGRIYERRSDISPDGKHFIYFAMNGKRGTQTRGSWTAISRAPYLKAIALFAHGDCWDGGGIWTGASTYWLNQGSTKTILTSSDLQRDACFEPKHRVGHECWGIYFPRLIRDGWRLVGESRTGHHTFTFEKLAPSGWILRKIANAGNPSEGRGCYWDEHQLLSTRNSATGLFAHPGWEWADIDGNRVVWASDGRLFAAALSNRGLENIVQLYDFNDIHFSAVQAPY